MLSAGTTLWFDVGIKRYTTFTAPGKYQNGLWFDVGIKRYTTDIITINRLVSCGLMWESKDIQPRPFFFGALMVVV